MRIPDDPKQLPTLEVLERMMSEQWGYLRAAVDRQDYAQAVRVLSEIFDLKLAVEIKSEDRAGA